ncbi:MAG: hypothetical protein KGM96_14345 [Acidobacteriota bacterium]|nr:hypothetical protein [Acidobacteriota bacterium]
MEEPMQVVDNLPDHLQSALSQGLLKRLPLTFLPFVNQQLHQWEYLFPNERQSVERLLLFVASLTPQQSSLLFRDVVQLEEKMGVSRWQFSTSEQTIRNSSELARSPYFQDWRRAVQAVFDQADQHALSTKAAGAASANRLVLLEIPQPLPLDAASAWKHWQGIGKPLKLELAPSAPRQSSLQFLLAGATSGGLLDAVRTRPEAAPADTWVVDAARSLTDAVLARDPSGAAAPKAILLSYQRLDLYRQAFSHEMNTMRKDLADADAVFDHLRKVDVTPWCPPEVAADPAVREFLRSLYLSGNGAVIYGNSFVEWAASEAFRRARPRFLAASFGVRSRPKPFTGVAVFDNPDQVNPTPSVDDLPGSAIDAQMLALYVWLAASRYDEYQRSTLCVCLAESIAQAYVVGPPECALLQETQPISLPRLRDELRNRIA